MTTIFETERLIVRRFTTADAAEVFEIYRDPAVWRYLGGGEPYTSVEQARERLARHELGYADESPFGSWAVVVRETNAVIGTVLVAPLEEGPEIEVGYHYGQSAWGMGYATEAAIGAIEYGFGVLKLDQLCGVVFPENLASQRVLEKAGMTYRGMRPTFGFTLMYYTIERDTASAQSQGGAIAER